MDDYTEEQIEELEKIATNGASFVTLDELDKLITRERAKLRPKWYEREPFVETLCRDKHGMTHLFVMYRTDECLLIDINGNTYYTQDFTPVPKAELLAYAESAPE